MSVSVPAKSTTFAASMSCTTGLTLTLHPGLPPSAGRVPLQSAPDIPRGPFTVSAPLYPGAKRLTHFVASPLWEYTNTPYLQTAVAEYRSTADSSTVDAWYRAAFRSCGWHVEGTMSTDAGVLTSGITFVWNADRHLMIDIGFGDTPSGGTYIGYAAEEVTLPPRPPASYLRGRFGEVRIAFVLNDYRHPQPIHRVVHVVVHTPATINRLVRTINSLTDILAGVRHCGGGGNGPAWLTFVRPNGQRVHAWEGSLCSGLHVNGTRALWDDGRVFDLIERIVRRGG